MPLYVDEALRGSDTDVDLAETSSNRQVEGRLVRARYFLPEFHSSSILSTRIVSGLARSLAESQVLSIVFEVCWMLKPCDVSPVLSC